MSKQYYQELIELLDQSYAPYSGFNVASIIVCKNGDVFKGVNVESAAYPTTICRQVIAEQSGNDAIVYCYNELGEVAEHSIAELLPHAFLGDEL